MKYLFKNRCVFKKIKFHRNGNDGNRRTGRGKTHEENDRRYRTQHHSSAVIAAVERVAGKTKEIEKITRIKEEGRRKKEVTDL